MATKAKKAAPAKKEAKAKPVTLITGADAINAAIKSIAVRGKKIDEDVQRTALSCLVHADKHGDVTLAQKLVEAVPASMRKNALRTWFIEFGKFRWDATKKALAYDKKATTQLDAAMATPFTTFKGSEGGNAQPFDLNKAIVQLIARAEKATVKGDKVPTKKLAILRELAA